MDVPLEIWVTIRWVAGAIVLAIIGVLIPNLLGDSIGGWMARLFDL